MSLYIEGMARDNLHRQQILLMTARGTKDGRDPSSNALDALISPALEMHALQDTYHQRSIGLPEINLNTLGHQLRSEKLALLAAMLAVREYGHAYKDTDLTHIQFGTRYHDNFKGQIDILRYIIATTVLTNEDRMVTHLHPYGGYKKLRSLGFPEEVSVLLSKSPSTS